jgi:uncharacterized protein YkwD
MRVLTATVLRKRTAVIIMAAAIGIGATACLPDTGPPPTADGWQRALYDSVNQDRANNGLAPLTFSPKLSVLAGGHSCDMQRAGVLYHSNLGATMNGPDFAAFWSLGENIVVAPSSMSPQEIEGYWMGSSTHRANILNPNFNVVGMAACFGPDGRVWASEEFGAL